ncbi:hypothetical protein [Govanella unica]|uniref:Uncharacterized protein n=1 Tax=Govanella unica TaxID=2975056 RepID=A0A9X3TVU0_9PROT|nr:hypothetical protein [Govania unica]MDA5192921.1 hypothetical protein [Govania unica]
MTDTKTAPIAPLGGRSVFLRDPDSERLLAMVMAVAAETAVLHDRLDRLERVAAEKERFSLADLAAYEPTAEVRAERADWMKDYIARLLRIFHETLDDDDGGARSAAYGDLMERLAKV